MQRVTDVHLHLSRNPDDVLIPYARQNGLAYTLEELLRLMDESGVARGLLLSPPLRGMRFLANAEVLSLCRESGGRLSPVLTVMPSLKGVLAALAAARRSAAAVKGFKILLGYFPVSPNHRAFAPLYDYAERKELPVMFHTGDTAESGASLAHSHPLALDPLANSRPGLKVVACHFGNPWIADVGELLYKHENVFADLSGLSVGGGGYAEKYATALARKVSEAIYYAGGAEKVLFGSDYPVTTPASALALTEKLDITAADRAKVLRWNAKRVFGL